MTPEERHDVMVAYLRCRLDEWDWHGVQDAASDLRELEARWPKLRKVREHGEQGG